MTTATNARTLGDGARPGVRLCRVSNSKQVGAINPMNTYNQNGLTMREAINRGMYYHVSIPAWASGGMDVIASNAKDAALHVGCMLEKFGGANRPDMTKVHKHLTGSSIGCAMLDEAEHCQTLTAAHYSI